MKRKDRKRRERGRERKALPQSYPVSPVSPVILSDPCLSKLFPALLVQKPGKRNQLQPITSNVLERLIDAEILADLANQDVVDLRMPWNRRSCRLFSVSPPAMTGSLAHECATLRPQMLQESDPFHTRIANS